ncbi:JAB domain-containing protein [Sphingomonas gilva]|nr:DNA repair protein RadC [Sphingomonas gilva]
MADALIDEFGSLGATLAMPDEAVARVLGRDARGAVALLSATSEAISHALRKRATALPIASSDKLLTDYLIATMTDLPLEQLRVLFLDRGNHLIRDEMVAQGTVCQARIYPREIIVRALELRASALIIVHNHPGGQAEPSRADIDITHQIMMLARFLDITVHDHLIVASGRLTSMRQRGLL